MASGRGGGGVDTHTHGHTHGHTDTRITEANRKGRIYIPPNLFPPSIYSVLNP